MNNEVSERGPERLTGSGDDEIWVKAKREHEAAGKILDALRPVSQAERIRILHYMWDKYVLHPDPPKEHNNGGEQRGPTI